MESIGGRIKEIRKELGLSQEKFGARVKVTKAHISKIELTEDKPSDMLIRLICMEFNINEEWLRTGKGNKRDLYQVTKKTVEQLEPSKLRGDITLNMQKEHFLATEYIKVVRALRPSGAGLSFIPFLEYPELIDMINYLQKSYLNAESLEDKIRIEVKFENAFHDYKAVVKEMKEKHMSENPDEFNHLDEPPIAAVKEEEIVYAPFVGKAAAGKPIEIMELHRGFVPISKRFERFNSFLVMADGDSMLDAGIGDGDLVVIKPQPEVENGEIALVNIGGEVTIKYFYKKNNHYELRSANPKYDPMIYKQDAKVSILGKVVDIIKKEVVENSLKSFE